MGETMDYRDWEILKELYHQKNLTKTARQLFLTQPALTTRLKHMQEELGVKIVTRESRGIHFTPQGEYLVHCAEEALAHYQRIKENVQNMSHNESDKVVGTLKLGVSNFFANYALPYVLKLFKKQYPHVEFKVTTGWSRDVTQLIHNKDVHISFVRGDYGWRGLSKHQLFEETICIASMDEIDIRDLPRLPRIEYKGDYLLKSIIDHWWGENYAEAPFISIEVDQVDTCKEMMINGLGYGVLSSRVLTGIDDLFKIHLTDQAGDPILRRTWMYYHKESLEWNVVKAFVSFIENFDWKDN
jgi:DNA-binding transcriptional LysR family regulator